MWNDFLAEDEAQRMYDTLVEEINWNRRIISKPKGKSIPGLVRRWVAN